MYYLQLKSNGEWATLSFTYLRSGLKIYSELFKNPDFETLEDIAMAFADNGMECRIVEDKPFSLIAEYYAE